MKKLWTIAIGLMIAGAAPAAAADDAAVLKPVHQFVSGLNKGDAKAANAGFADSAAIIDEFPPYHWAGANALGDWFKDFGVFAQANKVTEPSLKLVKRKSLMVTGDTAYYEATATFSTKTDGKLVNEPGIMTFSLVKAADGWRIAAWTWTKA